MTSKTNFELVEQFILEHKEAHYRLAYSYVRNKDNAFDIVQEAILKALQSVDRLEETRYLKTWFYRILVNTAIDFIRKHKRMTVMEDDMLEIHLPTTEMEGTNLDLQQAVDQLSPVFKTIILLRFFEDLKIEEVAEITGDNVNTVKTRLYAALKKLRLTVGEEFKA